MIPISVLASCFYKIGALALGLRHMQFPKCCSRYCVVNHPESILEVYYVKRTTKSPISLDLFKHQQYLGVSLHFASFFYPNDFGFCLLFRSPCLCNLKELYHAISFNRQYASALRLFFFFTGNLKSSPILLLTTHFMRLRV